MDDTKIIDLFFKRDEKAIQELGDKYGAYCYKIAWNVLNNKEDSEECVNDTWLVAWTYIPPKRPAVLSSFVGKITRGLAIDCLRKKYAAKRMDRYMVSIEGELAQIDGVIRDTVQDTIAEKELVQTINRFLQTLPEADRDIFLRRYWYLDTEKDIAKRHGRSVNAVKMNLYRSRKKLYKVLKAEGSVL